MSRASNFIRKALPTVMTVLGSAATIAAVIFAAKEGQEFKEKTEGKELTQKQKILTGVKTFKKTELCTVVSLGCGIGAHCLDLRTQASIVGAYTLLQSQVKKHQSEFDKYRKKIEKIYGSETDEQTMLEVKKEELPEEVQKSAEEGEKLTVHFTNFADGFSEITAERTMEDLLRAEIAINKMLMTQYEVTLNDALELFGLDGVGKEGNDVGWSADMLCDWTGGYMWLEIDIMKLDDGSYLVYPIFSAYSGFRSDYGLE